MTQAQTLFGDRLQNLVDVGIMRYREFEPKDKPYALCFSGGKDSDVIKRLAEMAGVDFEAHYNYVGLDPPELVAFIRQHHPEVIFHYPKEPFFKALVRKGFPPMRMIRWCCRILKEESVPHAGRVVITGIRWAESNRRSKRSRFTEQTTC